MASRRCFFKCLKNSHSPIELPHNVEVIIGRSKLTKIKDQSCSRKQLSLKANCEKCYVEVNPLGINPSGLNGFAMSKNCSYKLEHDSQIEVVLNNYPHIISFDPTPVSREEVKTSGKRKLDNLEHSFKKSKTMKMEPLENTSANKILTGNEWDKIDNGELYVFTPKDVISSTKIAAFDMDGTLISTKSGKVFPVDLADWQIAFPLVPQKLREHLENGYKIVIFSNQASIGNGRLKIEDFKKKIESIVDKLKLPIQTFISTGKGIYRKPAPGMWNVLIEKKNGGMKVNEEQSFYCGDAAGRIANWAPGKRKDHSLADILFAENLGLKFYTPEEFFLGHSISNVPMRKPEFTPKDVVCFPFNDDLISKEKEILVLVGYPGSGKSFLAKEIERRSKNKYATVCRDVIGTWQKCASKATTLIQQGQSVIVDSTNPDVESRQRWLSVAQSMGVACRCAKMATSKAHAQHNNRFRELMKINHLPVNEIVFNTYKSKFIQPSTAEGFKEVITVQFSPRFEDKDSETMYRMHLLEK